MENPLMWNAVERLIAAAMSEHDLDLRSGVIGASDIHYIYVALRDGKMLKPEYEFNT